MAEHRETDAALSRIANLQARINGLERFIDQLRDIEETFSTDTGIHPFRKYLASHPHHARSLGCDHILDPASGFPPAGSRGTYTDAMRRAGFSALEQANVWEAWRDMLRDELFTSYYANRDKS